MLTLRCALVRVTLASVVLVAPLAVGCSGKSAATPAVCGQDCIDGIALRSLRMTMKLVFNLTLQGKDAGAQDGMTDCPDGGTAHVYGTATANAVQGATMVDLTYDFTDCSYLVKDSTPEKNYHLMIDATVTEKGTIAVQPSANTALIIKSTELGMVGTVYDPPQAYAGAKCPLQATQDGNTMTGTYCGRTGSFGF